MATMDASITLCLLCLPLISSHTASINQCASEFVRFRFLLGCNLICLWFLCRRYWQPMAMVTGTRLYSQGITSSKVLALICTAIVVVRYCHGMDREDASLFNSSKDKVDKWSVIDWFSFLIGPQNCDTICFGDW
jgi:hypothetical protein